MAGGGLNILPHKSWNVYNRANRERVLRDEENARREEREARSKRNRAESEWRMERLRSRRGGGGGDDADDDDDDGVQKREGRVELFPPPQGEGGSSGGRGEAGERGARVLDERFRLGGRQKPEPWYARSGEEGKASGGRGKDAWAHMDDPLAKLNAGKARQRKEELEAASGRRAAEMVEDTGTSGAGHRSSGGREGTGRRRRKHRRRSGGGHSRGKRRRSEG